MNMSAETWGSSTEAGQWTVIHSLFLWCLKIATYKDHWLDGIVQEDIKLGMLIEISYHAQVSSTRNITEKYQ